MTALALLDDFQIPALLPKEPPTLIVQGYDGRMRPSWVGTDPILMDYYDSEWGNPIADEGEMFDLLCMLTFQAGLRWKTVLARRSALRTAFGGFSPDLLASWGQNDVGNLMEDPSIIRNRRKVEAILQNARATVSLRGDGGLVKTVWNHRPETTPRPTLDDPLPESSPESATLARELRDRGFTAVGPKSCFALMQAAGLVDANPVGAYRRGESGLWNEDGTRRSDLKFHLLASQQ